MCVCACVCVCVCVCVCARACVRVLVREISVTGDAACDDGKRFTSRSVPSGQRDVKFNINRSRAFSEPVKDG